MNKYQEALNYLKANCEQWVVNEDYRKNKKILDTTFEESDKSSELLQELVDKATPMKPIGKHTSFKCGRCGTRIRSGKGSSSLTKDTVCRNCYQVIDWSKDE